MGVSRRRWALGVVMALAATMAPISYAYAAPGDELPGLGMAAGILALLASAVLLREMLALRAVARGAAIAENVRYVVLAVLCLAASVLVGWIQRFLPLGFSADHARLGADLLAVVAIVLFVVYFSRVRRVLSRYLARLSGEAQLLTAVIDEEDGDPGNG